MGVQVQINGQWVDVADTTPSGLISAFGGAVAPTRYLICDGSAVSRTTYANLFAAIGTAWGSGDGSTTFNLPDLRGMFLRGAGTHATLKKANGNSFAGPAIGASQNDQEQGHIHNQQGQSGGGGSSNMSAVSQNQSTANEGTATYTYGPSADGTNGTPRAGDETRSVNFGVTYIIKT